LAGQADHHQVIGVPEDPLDLNPPVLTRQQVVLVQPWVIAGLFELVIQLRDALFVLIYVA
jgi:hypothetical protein